MQDGVKEYELAINGDKRKPSIHLFRRLRGVISESKQFPIVDYDREAAWTALRNFLRERGEGVWVVYPSKDSWTGFDQLILLTEPIAKPVRAPLGDEEPLGAGTLLPGDEVG